MKGRKRSFSTAHASHPRSILRIYARVMRSSSRSSLARKALRRSTSNFASGVGLLIFFLSFFSRVKLVQLSEGFKCLCLVFLSQQAIIFISEFPHLSIKFRLFDGSVSARFLLL